MTGDCDSSHKQQETKPPACMCGGAKVKVKDTVFSLEKAQKGGVLL